MERINNGSGYGYGNGYGSGFGDVQVLVVAQSMTNNIMNKRYVIVRTYSAGVFAGYLIDRNGKEVALENARRLWYWQGAASLSQLAMDGVSEPEKCKFPCEVHRVELTEVIEILDCTEEAQRSIASVPIWKH